MHYILPVHFQLCTFLGKDANNISVALGLTMQLLVLPMHGSWPPACGLHECMPCQALKLRQLHVHSYEKCLLLVRFSKMSWQHLKCILIVARLVYS